MLSFEERQQAVVMRGFISKSLFSRRRAFHMPLGKVNVELDFTIIKI
jgi:hypothetical protein